MDLPLYDSVMTAYILMTQFSNHNLYSYRNHRKANDKTNYHIVNYNATGGHNDGSGNNETGHANR